MSLLNLAVALLIWGQFQNTTKTSKNNVLLDAGLVFSFISCLARATPVQESMFAKEFPGLTILNRLGPISSFMPSILLPTTSLQPFLKKAPF